MHEPLLFGRRPGRGDRSQQHSGDDATSQTEDDNVSLALSEDRIKKRKPFPFVFVAIGVFFIILGTIAPKKLDQAVDDAVWQQMRMDTNDTRGFRDFLGNLITPPDVIANGSTAPEEGDSIYLRFYLFNVRNPHKKDGAGKFHVEEVGPYVYRVNLVHFNVSFFGEDTGDYERSHLKEVYFKTLQQVLPVIGGPHGGRNDSEIVTTVSMPYQAVMAIGRTLPSKALQSLVENYFLGSTVKERREKLFVTRSVREILFGYHETFQSTRPTEDASRPALPIDLVRRLTDVLRPYNQRLGRLTFSQRGILDSVPQGVDFPGFVQNFSSLTEADEKMEYDAQRVDRQMTNTYVWYQGSSQLRRCPKVTCPPLWGSREANRVLGSNGKFWGGKEHTENVVFLSSIVRSAKVVLDKSLPNEGDILVNGIQCKRWVLHSSVFSNVSTYPENAAYYATDQPDGLLNVGPLLLDIPIYASKPRFLHGDREALLASIEGMPDPDPALHDVTFDVHNETGISVIGSMRFQYTLKVPDGSFVPIFWFETIENMSNKHEKLFRKCDSYVKAARIFKDVGIALGILCLVVGVTIGTDRAEEDAKRLQAKSVYDHEHYHPRHLASLDDAAHLEENTSNVHCTEDKRGIALVLSSKSLRDAWLTTPPFVFMINVIIEMLTLKGKYVGIWVSHEEGQSSVALQLVLTALFVGIFVTISGVSVARAAFVRGEVPRRTIPFEPFRRRRCWALPWLFTDHACGMGVLVGLTLVMVYAGTALLVIYLFICGSRFSQDHCELFWVVFVAVKSLFAALESFIIFPLAALRTLHASTPSEQDQSAERIAIPLAL